MSTPRAETAVVATGLASVGVSFGLARYGYGLLLPDMRVALGLGSGTLGAIAAGSYVGYLLMTVVAGAFTARTGPRTMVLAAGALAAVGMALVARADGPAGLAVGVLVAGSAAGLALPPFSDVVATRIAPERRARAFATISSGTGAGVAIAAPIAVLAGASWRTAWLAFAGLAVVAALGAARVLPGRDRAATSSVASSGAAPARLRLSWFVCPRSGPLLVAGLLVALAASVWWTFAVDLVASSGVGRTESRVLQGLVGVSSLAGALGGDLVRRAGARPSYRSLAVLLAASFGALAVAPGQLVVAVLAGLAFGAAYNLLVAIQGLWSAEVFAERPSTGLAAVMTMSGLGLLLGPLVAGPLADLLSLRTTFAVAAGVAALALLAAPPQVAGQRPVRHSQ